MKCSMPPIDAAQWEVVFDFCARAVPIPQSAYYVGAVAVAAIIGGLIYRYSGREINPVHLRSATAVAVLASAGFVLVLISVAASWRDLKQAIDEHAYSVYEGAVTGFSPGDALDNRAERFSVGPRDYRVSAAEMTAAYTQTAAHGGVLREGLRVQVVDVRGEIARLAIARSF